MKDDRVYIEHILNSIERIEAYTEDVDQMTFTQNFIL